MQDEHSNSSTSGYSTGIFLAIFVIVGFFVALVLIARAIGYGVQIDVTDHISIVLSEPVASVKTGDIVACLLGNIVIFAMIIGAFVWVNKSKTPKFTEKETKKQKPQKDISHKKPVPKELTARQQNKPSTNEEYVIVTNLSGALCYIDRQPAIGECKNDGVFYCAEHGSNGYCKTCIEKAKTYTPTGIKVISWLLFLTAAFIVLLMALFGGLFVRGMFFDDSTFGILMSIVVVGITYFVVIGLPLILLGRALNRGSSIARLLFYIIAWVILFALPIGTITAIIIFVILGNEQTDHWFAMRQIKRKFS